MPDTFTFEDIAEEPESFSFEEAGAPETFSFEDIAEPKKLGEILAEPPLTLPETFEDWRTRSAIAAGEPEAPKPPEFVPSPTIVPGAPGEEGLYGQPTWAGAPIRALGKAREYASEKAKDVVGAYAFELLREPSLQAQALGIEVPGEPFTGEKPIEAGMKLLPPAARMASQAAYGIVGTAPDLAAVAGLQALGIPSSISAPIIFGSKPEGFDAAQALVIAGIPIAGRLGESAVVKLLSDAPVVKVALEQVGNTEKLRGKIVQNLGGLEISSDQLRQFMEAGGNFLAVNAYLLAAQSPEIMALPEEQRGEAIMSAVANNVGMSMLGFMRSGDMSQSLRNVVGRMAPELRSFMQQAQESIRQAQKGPRYTPTGQQLPEPGIEPPTGAPPAPRPAPKPPPAPAPAPVAAGFEGKPMERDAIISRIEEKHGVKIGDTVRVSETFGENPESGRLIYDPETRKPIGIELNRSKLATNGQVDWTIQHELAHWFDLENPNLSLRVREQITPKEWDAIQADILRRGYKPGEQAAERTVFAIQELIKQWRGRSWFGKLTGEISAFATRATGIKLTRAGAEATAVRAINQAVQRVGAAKPPAPTVVAPAVETAAIPTTHEGRMDLARKLNAMSHEEILRNAPAFNQINLALGEKVTAAELEELKKLEQEANRRHSDLMKAVMAETDPAKKEALANQLGSIGMMPQFFREAIDVAEKRLAKPAEAAKPEVAQLGTSERKNTLGDPLGTTYHATAEDWSQWQDVQARMKQALAAKNFDEFTAIQRESESLKNKYGGMPPNPPKTSAPTVPADIEKYLKIAVPDVAEAKTRSAAFQKRLDEINRRYGEIDQQIRELEKRILGTRGYSRGKIKSSTSKADREKYRELQKQRGEAMTERVTLEKTARPDREAVERHQDIQIINDPKQPLVRRIDRAIRMMGGEAPPELVKARDAEIYRIIRKVYPDATDEEIQKLYPRVAREVFFAGNEKDIIQGHNIPTIAGIRRSEIIDAIGSQESLPFQELPDELKDKINRFTKHFRAFEPSPRPEETPTRKDVDEIKREIISASKKIREEAAAAAEAKAKAEAEAAAQEEKLLVQAEETAASAGKPGTPGGRSAKAVRDDLVKTIKGAIQKVINADNVKIETDWERTKEDPEGRTHFKAVSEQSAAFGTVKEVESGRFEVEVAPVRDFKAKIKMTVDSMDEAKFIIQGMAAQGPGYAIFGVPGDGVWRIRKDGPTMIGILRDARKLEITTGKKFAISKGVKGERPPAEVRTAAQWAEAKEWHGLKDTDTIYDWSPALRKLAEHIMPAAPEQVTTAMVDEFIKTGKKPEAGAPPPPTAPPVTEPTPPKPPMIPPKERVDAIRERLKKKLAEKPPPEEEMALEDITEGAELPAELEARAPDASIFADAVNIGAYYIQTGLHQFEPWAAKMREDFGEAIEPYLKSVYETARISIESPVSAAVGSRPPGLEPGLDPPAARLVTARESNTVKADESVLPPELVPHLEPHQRQGAALGIQSLSQRGGVLIADGTGVGKTREALAIAHYWAKQGARVLIITRAETIKPDWKAGTFGGSYFNDAKAMGVKIRLARDANLMAGEIGITTYENSLAVMRRADPSTVLIWDESHSLKNRSARGNNGDRANAKAKSVLFMSATPADKPEHIYYLARMGIMEGKTVQQQLKDLGMTLVKMEKMVRDEHTGEMVRRTVHFWAPDQNVSEADRNERFNALFDRMTANGAMIKREISMKGVHVQVLRLALPPEAHQTIKDILNFFEADTIDDLKGLKKAIALMHLRRQQEPFKIAPAVMLAQRELEAGRQVVIFVSRVNESEVGKWVKGPGGDKFREVLMSSEGTAKALRNALHEVGIHDIAEIHGEADQASLEAMADFQSGKKRVVIATIESGGTGINLDDTIGNRPRSMIVMTAPFDAVGNVQAAGRIWRLKTLSGANIFYLFADTDVDAWNADIIGSKMAHLGAVVEGQVRRLDISDPDAVTTDDFHGKGAPSGKAPKRAPGQAFPKLEWAPYTTKAGESIFSAPATGDFWFWYKAGNQPKLKAMGAWVGRGADGKLRVFARAIPQPEAPAPEAPPPPPATPEEMASEPEVGEVGETGAIYAHHNTTSGLPPGIPDGGPEFAMELMEASRRFGTLVRSRSTLKAGVLGLYKPGRAGIARSDKIEVGDIRNQATVAHEMGHDIDNLLFPAIWAKPPGKWHSQESLAERLGLPSKDKKELNRELRDVSILMRGPIVGGPGHVRYRGRATELIADWFSLYAHDPARARSMAPKWTAGFEARLAADAETAETMRQLHSGVVEPIAPQTTLPPTGAPTGMPGAVPGRIDTPATRELRAALASETLVKHMTRWLESHVQRARIKAEQWIAQVPRRFDRYDVGAFVEGIGNLEIPGDTRDAVISRMTPAMKLLAKRYRFSIELLRQQLNAYLKLVGDAEYLAFLEDYLPHFYVNSKTPAGREAIARFRKNSPNARQRKLPTLAEAVQYGLVPITQDPAVLYEVHARINWRVATNRAFLAMLKTVKTSAGQPVVVPASQNPGSWPVSTNPLIQRVYARQTPTGLHLWRGGAAIHPDVWHAVRQILETPTRTQLGRLYDAINGFARANAFAFSGFHDVTLRAASLGAHGEFYNPLRGILRVLERDPVTGNLKLFQSTRTAGKGLLSDEDAVADAALHGLRFAWTESESYQKTAMDLAEKLALRLRDIPYLGRTARIASDLNTWRQRGLWRNTHDALKIMAYHDMVAKALASALPGTDPDAVKERIASLLNDAFGGQEWQTKFWLSPQARMVLARFWLAPDWTLSTLRSVPFLSDSFSMTGEGLARAIGRVPLTRPKEGWKGNIGRARFWTAELAALAMATIAAQFAIWLAFGRKDRGDEPWIWDNEEGQHRRIDVTPLMRKMPWWKPDEPTRYYVNLGKRPEEILTWFKDPFRNVQSKLARPIMEVIRQIIGTEGEFPAEWKREHMTFPEGIYARLKSVAGVTVPFTFSGNQFALSLPYRKGMSKYKAQQAFESAYEVMADPNRYTAFGKSIARGYFTENMDRVIEEIADAATRNGVPADAVRRRALSTVRGIHYGRYFRALKQGDQKTMEREAESLQRLGVLPRGILADVKRREKLEPRMP